MESSTTSATAGMSLQRAECTPPACRLAERYCRRKLESSRRGYHGVLLGRVRCLLLGFAFGALFDAHVFEFTRFEDLAALQAFHEFSIFLAADDLHARMFARRLVCVLRARERLRAHKSENIPSSNARRKRFAGISRYFSLAFPVVKPFDVGRTLILFGFRKIARLEMPQVSWNSDQIHRQ